MLGSKMVPFEQKCIKSAKTEELGVEETNFGGMNTSNDVKKTPHVVVP